MKMRRRDSRRERKFVFCLIGASVLAVVFMVVMTFYLSPGNKATRELERMAKEYYETYLYGSSLVTLEGGSDEMATFSEEGFQPVKLRQLLMYNGGKNLASQELFESDWYKCNLDQSEVIYRPVAPYGPKDYTIEYRTVCRSKD